MHFSTTVLALAAAANTAVLAHYSSSASSSSVYQNVTYITEVVTAYITYCPYPTHITHGTEVYTVNEPGNLTITNCPCTISKPVYTSSVISCTICPTPPAEASASASAFHPVAPAPTYPAGAQNLTSPIVIVPHNPLPSAGTPSTLSNQTNGTIPAPGSIPPVESYTGGAAAVVVATPHIKVAGAGMVGLLGLAVVFL